MTFELNKAFLIILWDGSFQFTIPWMMNFLWIRSNLYLIKKKVFWPCDLLTMLFAFFSVACFSITLGFLFILQVSKVNNEQTFLLYNCEKYWRRILLNCCVYNITERPNRKLYTIPIPMLSWIVYTFSYSNKNNQSTSS